MFIPTCPICHNMPNYCQCLPKHVTDELEPNVGIADTIRRYPATINESYPVLGGYPPVLHIDLDKLEEENPGKPLNESVDEFVSIWKEAAKQPNIYAIPKGKGEGLRFNQGKIRVDLVPAHAINEVAKVFTKGAEKYAERNWEAGMAWSKVTASLKRHLQAFEQSEDHDKETGLLHMAHVATNALFLIQYYKTYPQGDDRPHAYLQVPKIGLDIDEILCDWVGGFKRHFNLDGERPINWNFRYDIGELYKTFDEHSMKEFYLNLPAKLKPEDLPFEPHCYITSRSVDAELTKAWLQKNGFPTVPVYSVGHGKSKVEVAKESGIEIFVDDRYENFVELNNAGVCTFLYDAPHNQKYNVGYKRIKSLSELLGA